MNDKNEKLILQFSEISKSDIPFVGGKGANLGEMYNSEFPVPPGFCITAYAYARFLEETKIKDEMKAVLNGLDVDNNDALQSAARQVQTIIRAEQVPEYLAKAIKSSYESMYLNKYEMPSSAAKLINAAREPPFVAVRSSATAEDLPGASFAGQQSTYLNIKGTINLLEAVKNCWASLFTARAIFYRQKNNFDHFKVLICVVVQRMVDSTKSGVAFSVDPISEDPDRIIIEGSWGLGESIVSGEVNPDHYVVRKSDMKILETKIMKKELMTRRDPSGRTVKIRIEEPKRSAQVFSEDELINLAKTVKKIEEHYSFPQDIEWAIEGQKLFIVQSRPITTLKTAKEDKTEMPVSAEVILRGLPASQGIASGIIKIVNNVDELDKIAEGEILVTRMTDPDFVPAMKRAKAIVTDEGGMTSHAAIVSREMRIPCIVGTEKATQLLKDGDLITVDANTGKVYRGEVKITSIKAANEAAKEEGPIPETVTKIYINLGIPEEVDRYKDAPIDGVGLMRLEFIIADLIREHPMNMIKEGRSNEYVEKLSAGIRKVAEALKPRPIVVRFSDFKSNEYSSLVGGKEFEPKESNPMIGWRGVSRYVSPDFEPAFRLECQAIKKLRDSGLTNIWVMLPFVRNTHEVKECIKIIESEGLHRDELFKIWLMAEVPAMAIMPEEFAKLDIDGASIGSNDLTQLTLGVDRDSEKLGKMGYFDERNEAVLKSVKRIIDGFKKHGKTISLCGQAPSVYPEFAEFLIMSGITSVSVNPDVIEKTKRLVASAENKLKFLTISPD